MSRRSIVGLRFRTATVSGSERQRWKRPQKSIASQILLVAAIGIFVVLPSRTSGRIELVYPANGTATESDAINLLGMVSGRGHREVVVSVNGQAQSAPIAGGMFRRQKLRLQPGINIIQASLGRGNSDSIGIIAPRLAYHFERGDRGWFVVGRGAQPRREPMHRPAGPMGAFLLAQRARDIEIDLIIVFDTTHSMRPTMESVVQSTSDALRELRRVYTNTRMGLVSFRDLAALKAAQSQAGQSQAGQSQAGQSQAATSTTEPSSAVSAWELTDDIDPAMNEMLERGTESGGKIASKNDYPEDQYMGLATALDMFETEGEGKNRLRAILVISDASPKDPDDHGNTFDSIVGRASEMDVAIFSIIVRPPAGPVQDTEIYRSYEESLIHAKRIGESTGGKLFRIDDAVKSRERLIASFATVAQDTASWMWQAPPECVRAMRNALGESVHFAIQHSGAASESGPDVLLFGANRKIVLPLKLKPGRGWKRYRFRLSASAAWKDVQTRNAISKEEFERVLGSLQAFHIRDASAGGPEPSGLDRVVITSAH